ncbi:MAG: hypothetical protein ACYC9L_15435, partial [Sulfuricaulis sp.]
MRSNERRDYCTMKVHRICIALLTMLASATCAAYDTETHALITRAAYSNSVLVNSGPGSMLSALGLDRLYAPLLFRTYWEPAPDYNHFYYYADGGIGRLGSLSYPEAFERCQTQQFNNLPNNSDQKRKYGNLFSDTVDNASPFSTVDSLLPIQNWLVRGAIREDDLGDTGKFFFSSGVHCKTYMFLSSQGSDARSKNHFYDPYADMGLTVPGVVPIDGEKAVDWALGSNMPGAATMLGYIADGFVALGGHAQMTVVRDNADQTRSGY